MLGTFALKAGLAQMLKGGIIMDVTNATQAKIAEEAGVTLITTMNIRYDAMHVCRLVQ